MAERDEFVFEGPRLEEGLNVFNWYGIAAFVSTSKRNRDFLKIGLPVIRSRDVFYPMNVGLVSFFGPKDYLAVERTRGPVLDRPGRLFAEGRYGALYGAQAAGVRVGYTVGRFDLSAGTLYELATGRWVDYTDIDQLQLLLTGTLGVTVRRRATARTQLLLELGLPIGDRDRSLDGVMMSTVALRYEQALAGPLAVGVEGGIFGGIAIAGRTEFGERFTGIDRLGAHGALSLRYTLGQR